MAHLNDIAAQLRVIQAQVDLTFQAVLIIAKELPPMSELTEKLKALAAADAKKIATLAGLNGESNSTLAEVLPAFQANSDALSAVIDAHKAAHATAAANDDSKGQDSSVGQGSGSGEAGATLLQPVSDVAEEPSVVEVPGLPAELEPVVDTSRPVAAGKTILADGTQI